MAVTALLSIDHVASSKSSRSFLRFNGLIVSFLAVGTCNARLIILHSSSNALCQATHNPRTNIFQFFYCTLLLLVLAIALPFGVEVVVAVDKPKVGADGAAVEAPWPLSIATCSFPSPASANHCIWSGSLATITALLFCFSGSGSLRTKRKKKRKE